MCVKTVKYDAVLPQIALPSLVGRILGLGCGERLTLIGIGREVVWDALRSDMIRYRSALLLAPAGNRTSDAILDHLLDDLAEPALAHWPRWYGRDESSAEGLLEHGIANPLVSAPWLRAAVKRAGAGHSPRFRRVSRRLEFLQLMLAVDPSNPVLIASLDVDAGGGSSCHSSGAGVVHRPRCLGCSDDAYPSIIRTAL